LICEFWKLKCRVLIEYWYWYTVDWCFFNFRGDKCLIIVLFWSSSSTWQPWTVLDSGDGGWTCALCKLALIVNRPTRTTTDRRIAGKHRCSRRAFHQRRTVHRLSRSTTTASSSDKCTFCINLEIMYIAIHVRDLGTRFISVLQTFFSGSLL
jgi:hypothetical protein